MGDKGKGGIKNLKKWVTSFVDGLLKVFLQQDFPLIYVQEKKNIETFHIENDYLLFTTLFAKIYYFFLCILRVRTNIF